MKEEPSPLVPQGSFEAQAAGKSRVRLAFYTIVAIHVLAIAGFLIIGCKREEKDSASNTAAQTNDLSTPPFGTEPGIVSAATNTNPPLAIPPSIAPANTGVTATLLIPQNTVTSSPEGVATEHTIVKNDTFATLATKYGVSVKAIQAANPNLNPTKLKIGDKVKIPAKTATMAGNGTTANATDAGGLYTVKSGDTLSKIASAHRTTVKELQKLNNLSTTQIRVGQKLKVPQAATAPAPAP
jgi:LysM repeat protein